ncbi:MAG: membrane-bound lytic murein transglycosylase MltF [Gammaproteobacteria bacterium]|nr:membrane-bound lytic murein transglycosylase MltF [Gammaproteobacteria bacterium]
MKKFFSIPIIIILSSIYLQPADDTLTKIRQSSELIIVTRNAPTTYYNWHDKITGPEYDMTLAFADYLGVEAKYLIKDSISEVIAAIENGEAHIAAAGLTRTSNRGAIFLFGPAYQEVKQQIVCHRNGKSPESIENISNVNLVITANTSYEEQLIILKNEYPELSWHTDQETDTENLLEKVWTKEIDCTIADSNIVAINQRYYPELQVSFDLTEPEQLAWMLPVNTHSLRSELVDWFDDYEDSGELQSLKERYYGYVEQFDYVDTIKFVKRIETKLPKYQQHFEKAASKYKLDWTLLAAQAYQESHWQARAKSPTGVRGIMMLTLETAREIGIKKRLDPAQSIMGGASYLNNLYQRVPQDVREEDRIWFALAAYNVGMGHIHDARELAQKLNKDPDSWSSLAEVLPLLSRKQYYKNLRHGYARGNEPVTYVRHIRDYQNILLQKLNN